MYLSLPNYYLFFHILQNSDFINGVMIVVYLLDTVSPTLAPSHQFEALSTAPKWKLFKKSVLIRILGQMKFFIFTSFACSLVDR